MRRVLAMLGEDVSYVRGTGTPANIRGVFTRPYQTMDLGSAVRVTGSNPVFAAMTADLPSGTGAVNDQITRSTVTYSVLRVEPTDPSGITVLELRKVA